MAVIRKLRQNKKKWEEVKELEDDGYESDFSDAGEYHDTVQSNVTYAYDSSKSAGKSFLKTMFSAAKFAYHTIGAVAQLLYSGLKSFGDDASHAKAAFNDGVDVVKEGAKTLGNAADASIELVSAAVKVSAPYVKSATKYTMDAVGGAVIKGIDYAFSVEGNEDNHETELTTFRNPISSELFAGLFDGEEESTMFDTDVTLIGRASSVFDDQTEDADLFGN